MTEPIVSHGGHGLPFSKGLTAQSLSASGLSPPRAFELAREVERRLLADGTSEIDLAGLRELTGEVLLAAEGEGALRRWRGWSALDRLDPPLIVLVGGAAGVGKSTLASMLAARLGITRVIATDVIRQVLRSFFTAEAVPAVHASAFELDLEGFAEQTELVGTGTSAIVERACQERTPIVVEGVHAVPGTLDPELLNRCVAVEAMLVVSDEDLHRGHFTLRGAARPAQRYLTHFAEIRALQDHLTECAHAKGVAVIENRGADDALQRLMELVLDTAGERQDTSG